MPATS